MAVASPKPGKLLAVPGAELPLGLAALRAAIREHQTAGKKTLPAMARAFRAGRRWFFNHFSRQACRGSQHPRGVFSDLSIQCRPEGSSEPLSVEGKR